MNRLYLICHSYTAVTLFQVVSNTGTHPSKDIFSLLHLLISTKALLQVSVHAAQKRMRDTVELKYTFYCAHAFNFRHLG